MLFLTIGACVLGVYNFNKLPIDAVPDITNVQVQINTEARGYSPLEVEQRITYPIETALAGIPHLNNTRSLSRYGLSQVTAIFDDEVNIYFARQLINEKIQQIKDSIPEGLNPTMGPISTGLGEIYFYSVEAEKGAKKDDGSLYTDMDLLTIQKWIIAPQLKNIRGVIEVNTIGGHEQQYHITPNIEQLLAYDLAIDDIIKAIERNNDNVGAGYIERNGEQYLVRVPGQLKSIPDIEDLTITKRDDVIIKVKNVAKVALGYPLRTGAATKNSNQVVLGTVMMLIGENSREVSEKVDKRIKEIAKNLPKGVTINTLYDRTRLVDLTINTVKNSLLEGALLVIVILFLLLGNFRAAVITASIIPISMLITISGMVENRVSGNLMSLGALDFGLIVDGAVIIIENCIRRFSLKQQEIKRLLTKDERYELVAQATSEVIKPSIFGVLIITVVYLPIFTLSGVEGKMFHPMAFTVVTALLSSLILCLTFIPASIAIFLTGRVKESDNIVVHTLTNKYEVLLLSSLQKPRLILVGSSILVALSIIIATNMGSEFIPSLDEGDIAIQVSRAPGTSLTQSIAMQSVLEKEILAFPEVNAVVSRIGTAEVATDPMPPNIADMIVLLKSKTKWPDPAKSKASLVKELESTLNKIPGSNYEFSQPIELRFNEIISGVRSDLAIKIYGEDFDKLQSSSKDIEKIVKSIKGAADVKIEQVTGLPMLNIIPKKDKISKYGLNIKQIQNIVDVAIGGGVAGSIYDGDKRFTIIVRLPDSSRTDLEQVKRIPIPIHRTITSGLDHPPLYIPLSEVADVQIDFGPAQISRENGKRRMVVTANVRDTDLGSFVTQLQTSLSEKIKLPTGYWIEYGGTFEQMISAKNRLMIVVPVALLLILGLLFVAFESVIAALIVFSGIPLALTGGVLALLIRGIPLSISAGIGFIALSGVAVLNGMVMITFIRQLEKHNHSLETSIIKGAVTRLRPVITTALVASLGFVPMAINTGAGAEVQQPLATVVIGGIISSTILTLFVLPLLYKLLAKYNP